MRDGARIEGDATAATSFNEPPLRAAVSELPLSMRAAPSGKKLLSTPLPLELLGGGERRRKERERVSGETDF